jgi:hypothetical protein
MTSADFCFITKKCIIMITGLTFLFFPFAQAQIISPKLTFVSPVLVSGAGGQKHASNKLSNIILWVDAFIKIEGINNGTKPVNINEC